MARIMAQIGAEIWAQQPPLLPVHGHPAVSRKRYPVKSISRQGSRVRPARLDSRPGQGIATFIFSMAVVAAHPVPFDLVLSGQFQQALPEVPVGNRLFLGIFPTAPDPALDPLGHPFFDIFRVSGQSNAARAPAVPPSRRWPRSAPCGCWWFPVHTPDSSFSWPPQRSMVPQPPGPGLPEQAPSENISINVSDGLLFLNSDSPGPQGTKLKIS